MVALRPAPSLLSRLRADYDGYEFAQGSDFRFCPAGDGRGTVYYANEANVSCLLHELAHAVLGHTDYDLDIDLLTIERTAWDYTARVLAPRYGITIDRDEIEDALDTYRDWLHNRSLCPGCNNSGLQGSDGRYTCVLCLTRWRANEARSCALRRYADPPGRLLQPL